MDFFANLLKSMTNQQLKIDPMVFLDLINKINGSDLASGTCKVKAPQRKPVTLKLPPMSLFMWSISWKGLAYGMGLLYMGLVGQLYMLQCYKQGKGIILQ